MNLESILNKELKMAEKENWVSIENKIHTHTHIHIYTHTQWHRLKEKLLYTSAVGQGASGTERDGFLGFLTVAMLRMSWSVC